MDEVPWGLAADWMLAEPVLVLPDKINGSGARACRAEQGVAATPNGLRVTHDPLTLGEANSQLAAAAATLCILAVSVATNKELVG